jgi:hypothetical protein
VGVALGVGEGVAGAGEASGAMVTQLATKSAATMSGSARGAPPRAIRLAMTSPYCCRHSAALGPPVKSRPALP